MPDCFRDDVFVVLGAERGGGAKRGGGGGGRMRRQGLAQGNLGEQKQQSHCRGRVVYGKGVEGIE